MWYRSTRSYLSWVLGTFIGGYLVSFFSETVLKSMSMALYSLFISTIFSLVVQGIAYSFRFGELGGFIVLILLITQLAAGSGTFPSELQNKIFSSIHPFIPFTYSIEGFRQLLHEPNLMTIFRGQLYLLIFLVIVPISLGINFVYDKRNYSKIHGKYPSFEIEFHDE